MATDKRRARLEQILKREKEKELLENKVLQNTSSREPAKFRSTILDIDQPPTQALRPGQNRGRNARAAACSPATAAALLHRQQLEAMECAREAELAAAQQRRAQKKPQSERLRMVEAKRESEWNKLSTFEAEMFARDQNAQKEAIKEQIAGQRTFLDQQVRLQEQQHELERQEQVAVAEQIARDVESYKNEEFAFKVAAAKKNAQLKVDRDTQIRLEREKKEKRLRKQRLEEKREVEEIKRILEVEKQKSKTKKDNEKAAAMKLMKDNEDRLAMRRQQDKEKERHDFQMMEQYRAMLEREEKNREERLTAMYAKARQRAQVIGEDVLAQSEATKEKLELLERQAYDDKCAEDDRQDQLKKEALRRKMLETLDTLRDQQKTKEDEEAAERQELKQYYKQVKDKDAREAQAELDKAHRARLSNIANRNILFEQIKEAEERRIEEEVSMTTTERQLNSNLIRSANFILG